MSDFREQTGDAKQSDMLFVSQQPAPRTDPAGGRRASADRLYRTIVAKLCVMADSHASADRDARATDIAQDVAMLRDMVR